MVTRCFLSCCPRVAIAARDKGRVEKTGFAAARAAKDEEREDNRCKAFTADEAIVTMWMVMTETCDIDKGASEQTEVFFFPKMPRPE